MTDQEVVQYGDDLEMMRRPHLWPRMCLPLKRKKEDGTWIEGVLWTANVQGRPKFSWLEGQNIFGPPMKNPKWVHGGDELLVKLVHEGWLVD